MCPSTCHFFLVFPSEAKGPGNRAVSLCLSLGASGMQVFRFSHWEVVRGKHNAPTKTVSECLCSLKHKACLVSSNVL